MPSDAASAARRSTPARLAAAYVRAVSAPWARVIAEYIAACRALTLAVVQPVTPPPTRPASSTANRCASRLSSRAAVRPATPPPTTATSTSRSASSAGYAVVGAVASQRERVAEVVRGEATSGACPGYRRGKPGAASAVQPERAGQPGDRNDPARPRRHLGQPQPAA